MTPTQLRARVEARIREGLRTRWCNLSLHFTEYAAGMRNSLGDAGFRDLHAEMTKLESQWGDVDALVNEAMRILEGK